MNYEIFKEKLKQKDKRNIFGESLEKETLPVPKELQVFYQYVNPIDVEVVLDDLTSVKFFSLNELTEIQEDYKLNGESFVFASREGDPIILKNGKVYTAVHGSTAWELEHLHYSFEEFLQSLTERI